MATIKAGTYRFNDVLTAPSSASILNVSLEFSVPVSPIADDEGNFTVVNTPFVFQRIGTYGDCLTFSYDTDKTVIAYFFGETPNELITRWDGICYSIALAYKVDLPELKGVGQTITVPYDQDVDDAFETWFTANTVKQGGASTPTTISYNGNTLAELEEGQTAVFPQDVKAKTDVAIAFGAKGSITYNGVTTEIEKGKTANLLCAGKKFGTDVVVAVEKAVANYLTFSSPTAFTLSVVDKQKYWDGILEYSTDASIWNTWSGTSAISSNSDGAKHNLYLRGSGNTVITGSLANDIYAKWVLAGDNISCSGNIETLLDFTDVSNGNHPIMASNCYRSLFYGCTSLITAPELPATTLAVNCYHSMFHSCSNLTTTPKLPAAILTDYCYYNMFYGCTSLITAPELPATTLAKYCYGYMFAICTNLTTAPKLPAAILAESCYRAMFNKCSNLTTIPELPATTLAKYCYRAMFNGCTSIKLSTTKTGAYQAEYRIPKSGTGTSASDALREMFYDTGGTFTGTPSINTTYYTSNEVV